MRRLLLLLLVMLVPVFVPAFVVNAGSGLLDEYCFNIGTGNILSQEFGSGFTGETRWVGGLWGYESRVRFQVALSGWRRASYVQWDWQVVGDSYSEPVASLSVFSDFSTSFGGGYWGQNAQNTWRTHEWSAASFAYVSPDTNTIYFDAYSATPGGNDVIYVQNITICDVPPFVPPTHTPTATATSTVTLTASATGMVNDWLPTSDNLPFCATAFPTGSPVPVASLNVPYFPTQDITTPRGTSTLGLSSPTNTASPGAYPTRTETPTASHTVDPLTATARGTLLTTTPVHTWSITPTLMCKVRPPDDGPRPPVVDVSKPTVVSSICLAIFPGINTDATLFEALHIHTLQISICPTLVRLQLSVMGINLTDILSLAVALVAARLVINSVFGSL